MRASRNEVLIHGQRKCSHDVPHHKSLLLVALFWLNCNLPCADSLSLPGRRLFRRQATSADTEELYRASVPYDYYDDGEDLSGRSPAFTSSLFTSPEDRSRQRIITHYRRNLLRREGIFQLNYKEYDGDYLGIIESSSNLSVRPRVLGGWRKRKSLSKALFPVVEPDSGEPELAFIDRIDTLQDVAEEGTPEPAVSSSKPIGIGKITRKKKKKNQVVVSNISELHEAILDRGLELRDVELKYSPPPSLLTSKKQEPSNSVADPTVPELSLDEVQSVLMMDEPDIAGVRKIEFEIEDDGRPTAEEWPMIGNVLAEDSPFLTGDEVSASEEAKKIFSHDVLNLLHQRYHSHSTPMSRAANDTAILALSIEGGGMRGAVSGGMAAAIACLGLSNAFDSIYGSSAGSIIGSYFVSRQLYLDVYTDVIPAGKDLFVSKSKIIGDIFRNMFHVIKAPLGKRLNANLIERFNPDSANGTMSSAESLPPTRAGGLNISFVLDSIMCPDGGLRPLDLEAFAHNDAVQPLRIVSSAVELDTGKLKSVCFGSKEGHFKDQFANPAAVESAQDSSAESSCLYPQVESAKADENGYRRGLWACLGASMTVPGAAGSPFRMDLPGDDNEPTPHLCFDAFCYEPVPFRSAVAEGATHVVALRSRPAGFEPKTKPTLYERAVAPLYFRSNGVPNTVADFFEKGGQQYLYAEDVLICDEGLNSTEPMPIPPRDPIYASPNKVGDGTSSRTKWARAHILPITVPADVPELSTLSQDRDDILAGIRSGFAAAYDALAPVVGLEVGLEAGSESLNGMKVAELVFPKEDADAPHTVLEKQTPLAGEKLGRASMAATEQDIISASSSTPVEETAAGSDLSSSPRRYARFRFRRLRSVRRAFRSKKESASTSPMPATNDSSPPPTDALFSFLPGVQVGSLPLVAERLQSYLESHM